jgi:hypothetical protein
MRMLLLFAEQRYPDTLETGRNLLADFIDPEGRFYWVRHLSQMDELDLALHELRRVVASGYFCAPTLATDPWLEPLRGRPEFDAIRTEVEGRRRAALEVFRNSGGAELLGVDEPF